MSKEYFTELALDRDIERTLEAIEECQYQEVEIMVDNVTDLEFYLSDGRKC